MRLPVGPAAGGAEYSFRIRVTGGRLSPRRSPARTNSADRSNEYYRDDGASIACRRPYIMAGKYFFQTSISSNIAASQREVFHGSSDWRYRAGFRSRDDGRQNPLPRLDWRPLDGAVLTSQGFYPGLHHRARHHGAAE